VDSSPSPLPAQRRLCLSALGVSSNIDEDDTDVTASDLFLWAQGQNDGALSLDGASWYTTGRVDARGFASGEGSIEGWVRLDPNVDYPADGPDLLVAVGDHQVAVFSPIPADPNEFRLRYGVPNVDGSFSAVQSSDLEKGVWHYFLARHWFTETPGGSWIQLRVNADCFAEEYGVDAEKPETLTIYIGGVGAGDFIGRIDSFQVSNISREPTSQTSFTADENSLLLFNFDAGAGMPLDQSGFDHGIVPVPNSVFDDHGSCGAAWWRSTTLAFFEPEARRFGSAPQSGGRSRHTRVAS
jgi:hypothetical protein